METLTAIRERRSVKHYDPDHRITEAELSQLLEAACLSPTSFNMQNWRFVAVTDPAKKEALCAAAYNQAQVKEASLALVICADLDAHQNAERYWREAPEAVREVIVPMIEPFYGKNPELQRDEAMRSVGIAAQTIMLAAKAMGYDSCPMIGFNPAKVAEIIALPERHLIGLMITVGKALKPASPRPGQLPTEALVLRDSF
jgi:nitroreductase